MTFMKNMRSRKTPNNKNNMDLWTLKRHKILKIWVVTKRFFLRGGEDRESPRVSEKCGLLISAEFENRNLTITMKNFLVFFPAVTVTARACDQKLFNFDPFLRIYLCISFLILLFIVDSYYSTITITIKFKFVQEFVIKVFFIYFKYYY